MNCPNCQSENIQLTNNNEIVICKEEKCLAVNYVGSTIPQGL